MEPDEGLSRSGRPRRRRTRKATGQRRATGQRKATYLALLAGCATVTLPLEIGLGARVYRQPRRLAATLAPVAAVFTAWDVAAIRAGWWSYDPDQTSGVVLPGDLPLEEALFFVVVPVCAILTLEAVRRRRPAWAIGDE